MDDDGQDGQKFSGWPGVGEKGNIKANIFC
jgi:hypothetical protein